MSSSATSSPARPSGACARPPSRATAPAGGPPTATAATSRSCPTDHQGDRDKRRVTLEPVRRGGRGRRGDLRALRRREALAEGDRRRLNKPGGPPSPRHVDAARNLRGDWAATTIRAMLKNPVYTGRTVWNRLDFTEAKHAGGGARRARPRGMGGRRGRPPGAGRRRDLRGRPGALLERGPRPRQLPRQAQLRPLGHGPLLRGPRAALDAGQGPQGPPLLRLRIRGGLRRRRRPWRHTTARSRSRPARTACCGSSCASSSSGSSARCGSSASRSSCAHRPAASAKNGKLAGTRLRKQIAEIDRKIKAQVQALEKGVEPELVSERIAELRGDKEALEEALAEVGAEREEAEDEELARQLARVPDLTKALGEATPEVQRQVFEAFDLKIAYDKVGRRDRDLRHRLGGGRRCLRERESPPEGGLGGGSKLSGYLSKRDPERRSSGPRTPRALFRGPLASSGGPIRLSLPPA